MREDRLFPIVAVLLNAAQVQRQPIGKSKVHGFVEVQLRRSMSWNSDEANKQPTPWLNPA